MLWKFQVKKLIVSLVFSYFNISIFYVFFCNLLDYAYCFNLYLLIVNEGASWGHIKIRGPQTIISSWYRSIVHLHLNFK